MERVNHKCTEDINPSDNEFKLLNDNEGTDSTGAGGGVMGVIPPLPYAPTVVNVWPTGALRCVLWLC